MTKNNVLENNINTTVLTELTDTTTVLEEKTKVKISTKRKFSPIRFSVRGMRRHVGVITSRNPIIGA